MIEVRLFATFREGREKVLFLESDHYASVDSILTKLQIPASEVAILLVNGIHSKPDAPVKDGDIIALFPPIGGG